MIFADSIVFILQVSLIRDSIFLQTMKPKNNQESKKQDELFKPRFELFINLKHPLVQMANKIDWGYFDREFGVGFDDKRGRPALPTRLMVALTYLKYLHDLSDEAVVSMFLENNYWQYFCGYEVFQTEFPCDPSSMTRWRKRVGEEGAEKILSATLHLAHEFGFINGTECERVIADTTVQEKNIAFPTDAKLVARMTEYLVAAAVERGVALRQSYARVNQHLLLKCGRYAHAKQFKRSKRALKKLKTHLGRVIRDIDRKVPVFDEKLKELMIMGRKIQSQERYSENKIYSIHEPKVDCIAKGKAHKPYEFGCKAGIIVTAKNNWVVGAKAFSGNPYDGATLKAAINQTEKLTGVTVKQSFLDKGYRGSAHHPDHVSVFLSGRRNLPPILKRLLKRRSSIEPIIGHLKSEHRLNVNRLKGIEGDRLNVILSGSAFNLKKIMNKIFFWLRILLAKWNWESELQLK